MKKYDFYEIGRQEGEMHIQSIKEISPLIGKDWIEAGQEAALAALANLERMEREGYGNCDEAVRLRGYLSKFD